MRSSSQIKIVLADDHEVFRDGFRSLIEKEPAFQLVAEATNGYDLLNIVAQFSPDVIITDIKMPGLSGVEATRQIMKKFPGSAIIALSMANDDHLIMDMLAAGANGYILKDARKSEYIEAIRSVNNNHPYYCRSIELRLARLKAKQVFDPVKKVRKPSLTPRERQILILICQEKLNTEISESLGISVRTVEVFRKNLLDKTECRTAAGLAVYAVTNGIYDPGDSSEE